MYSDHISSLWYVLLVSKIGTLVLGETDSSWQTIPNWKIQSSEHVGDDIETLSGKDLDTSDWYTVSSRSTIMAGLLEAGLYNDTELFFSDNLETELNYASFNTTRFYRHSFKLKQESGIHHLLETNGITSRADIYLNGLQIANSTTQAGAYNGQWYDITNEATDDDNVLLIKVYPSDYNRDFALGFVDWNPYPPDKGQGVWRDVRFKSIGQVHASDLRIVTDFEIPTDGPVVVTVKADVHNLADTSIDGMVQFVVSDPEGSQSSPINASFSLASLGVQTVTANVTIDDPQIWWPHFWGSQPLYTVSGIMRTSISQSDIIPETTFGIRHVKFHVNAHNDTVFTVNGQPFQVVGGGYSADIFLRFNETRLTTQFQYMLDIGLNTVRLEGKQEHPELYTVADRLGLMVMAGWECCDKWEAWTYNEDVNATLWSDHDYEIAGASMRHEATMMQTHPSVLAFLVGSDYWPDDRATEIYVSTLAAVDWQAPIIASAAKRSYPALLGPSGLKMDGPYDWVSPNYWAYPQLGGAFGFGSELGAGVGTPELGSLNLFLSDADKADLWQSPDKGLYHMSTNVSSFYDRSIYNTALWARYGTPTSLDDYLLKAQMMDYEATRAQFEGYSALWNAPRPATGLIYWMLNNAWPSLHWNLFDYYLHPAGSYYGAKAGSRQENVAYLNGTLYLINHSLNTTGSRTIDVSVVDLTGKTLNASAITLTTVPNTSKDSGQVVDVSALKDVAFLRTTLTDDTGAILSRNVYWLSKQEDALDWDNSTWYNTPNTEFADFTAMNNMATANLIVTASPGSTSKQHYQAVTLNVHNTADAPAVFIRLNVIDIESRDVTPVYWSDNYITLWPNENIDLVLEYPVSVAGANLQISGKNIGPLRTVSLHS